MVPSSSASPRFLVGAFAVLAASLAATPFHGGAVPGVTATLKMTLQPPALGNRAIPPTNLSGAVRIVNGKARVDLDQSTGPALDFKPGDYMLLLDSARALYFRPGEQVFWDVDSPFDNPLGQMAGGARGMGQMTLTGVTVRLDSLGAGEPAGEFATRRFRVDVQFGLAVQNQQIPVQIVTDLLVAKLPVTFANAAIGGMGPQMLTSRELADKVEGIMAHLAGEGVIVRSATTTTFSIAGASASIVHTSELTDIKTADVDEAVFRRPEGYRPGL